tara:strand:- start:11269 stop:11595 length:327 start_codon:yes stop_codon:yes gene_type:complete
MLSVETAGVRIAAELEEAERLTNECMRAYARLQMSMMSVRLDTELPQYQGHTAVMRVQEAQKAQVEAMGQLARAHKAMRDDFLTITAIPDTIGRCPVNGVQEASVKAA